MYGNITKLGGQAVFPLQTRAMFHSDLTDYKLQVGVAVEGNHDAGFALKN